MTIKHFGIDALIEEQELKVQVGEQGGGGRIGIHEDWQFYD
jgi:hypothetical protein